MKDFFSFFLVSWRFGSSFFILILFPLFPFFCFLFSFFFKGFRFVIFPVLTHYQSGHFLWQRVRDETPAFLFKNFGKFNWTNVTFPKEFFINPHIKLERSDLQDLKKKKKFLKAKILFYYNLFTAPTDCFDFGVLPGSGASWIYYYFFLRSSFRRLYGDSSSETFLRLDKKIEDLSLLVLSATDNPFTFKILSRILKIRPYYLFFFLSFIYR